ncbi:hypothetical protein [Caballeronia sp. ATUFL_M1_KS5A]|uniref:hypothetical protein n=1 Tax=Caballeronia sp. ATUFL_M1_KS5A TaxID=2921778 RepID=UPI002027E5E8|nr:hypothetical protein [Caballeronia sp. ATUFL_M1_KS5A]
MPAQEASRFPVPLRTRGNVVQNPDAVAEARLSSLLDAKAVAILEATPELDSIIERLHQSHGYLARAEADLLHLRSSLRMLATQKRAAQADIDAAVEQATTAVSRTVENRVQLALDASRNGINVTFFCVDHFENPASADGL